MVSLIFGMQTISPTPMLQNSFANAPSLFSKFQTYHEVLPRSGSQWLAHAPRCALPLQDTGTPGTPTQVSSIPSPLITWEPQQVTPQPQNYVVGVHLSSDPSYFVHRCHHYWLIHLEHTCDHAELASAFASAYS